MKLNKLIRANFDTRRKEPKKKWTNLKINILTENIASFEIVFVSEDKEPMLDGKHDTIFGTVEGFNVQYWIMITGHNPIEGSIEFELYLDKNLLNKFMYTRICQSAIDLYKDSKLYRDYIENEKIDDFILENMPEDDNHDF